MRYFNLMRGRAKALDGLRGIAVFLTFCVHYFGTYLLVTKGTNPDLLSFASMATVGDGLAYILFRSHYGVYLFFVISGFLIGRLIVESERRDYWGFIRRRVLRIYPPFLISLFAIVVFRVSYQGGYKPGSVPTITGVLGNLVFLNGIPWLNVQVIVPNHVTWSLFFEMAFYLVVPCAWLIAPGRMGLAVASFVGLTICFICPVWTVVYLFTPLFFGALLACVDPATCKALMSKTPQSILFLIVILVASLWCFDVVSRWSMLWLVSLPGVLLVAEAVYMERVFSAALKARPLVLLGEISYSFYLMHSVTTFGLMQTSGIDLRTLTFPQVMLFSVACFSASFAVSGALFLISEMPYFLRIARPVSLAS